MTRGVPLKIKYSAVLWLKGRKQTHTCCRLKMSEATKSAYQMNVFSILTGARA
jgi:hypothetical protein